MQSFIYKKKTYMCCHHWFSLYLHKYVGANVNLVVPKKTAKTKTTNKQKLY